MRMDIISLVVQSLLAVLALIIAIFQWNAEKRAAEEEKKEQEDRRQEKQVIQQLLQKVSDAEECSRTMTRFRTEMSALSRRSDNDPQTVMDLFDEMIRKYEESFREIAPTLREIYEALLKNEERFPMSNGYSRYILDLREILHYDALERERRNNDYDSLRARFHQTIAAAYENDGVLSMDERLELGSMVERMIRGLEPYYRHTERIAAVLYELKAKYGGGSPS